MATLDPARASVTSLSLTADDVALLRSVVEFASESETYSTQDSDLERLYRRLGRAATRLAH